MDALAEILKVLGGAAAMVLAAGWLARSLVTSMLSKDLKAYELGLKGKADAELAALTTDLKKRADADLAALNIDYKKRADAELATLQDQLQRDRDAGARRTEAARAHAERLRAEVLRWANPIRGAVLDLKSRLENILRNGAHLALQRRPATPIAPCWSISYAYFLPSTLFLFCQYFHWVRRLQLELNFELFETHAEKDAFMAQLRSVSNALSEWPAPDVCSGIDREVFSLQQRALGEALIVRSDGGRCMGYDEFLLQSEESPLVELLAPLGALLDDLAPTLGDCRWARLERVLTALEGLDGYTRILLQAPTPPFPAVARPASSATAGT